MHLTPREAAIWLAVTFNRGGTVFLAGCGGFHAHACHIAAELVVRYKANRAPLRAIALGCNPAIVTAAVNDFGPDQLFQRELLALARPGDALMTYSTSGTSLPLRVLRHALPTISGQPHNEWHRVLPQEDALTFDHRMCAEVDAIYGGPHGITPA